jgi:hypothetical protein
VVGAPGQLRRAAAKLALPWARIRSRDAMTGPAFGPKTRWRAATTRSIWVLKPARAPCRAATQELAGGTIVVLVVVLGGSDVDVVEVDVVDVLVVVPPGSVVDVLVVVGVEVEVVDVLVVVDTVVVVVEVLVVVGTVVVVDVLVVVPPGSVVDVVEVDEVLEVEVVEVLEVVDEVLDVVVELEVVVDDGVPTPQSGAMSAAGLLVRLVSLAPAEVIV